MHLQFVCKTSAVLRRDGYSILVLAHHDKTFRKNKYCALRRAGEPHSCQYIHALATSRGFSILQRQTKFTSKLLYYNVIISSIFIDYQQLLITFISSPWINISWATDFEIRDLYESLFCFVFFLNQINQLETILSRIKNYYKFEV